MMGISIGKAATGAILGAIAVTAAGGAQAADTLRLLTWADYAPKDVIDAFTKETGITVDVTLSNNEEMISKLRAGSSPAFQKVGEGRVERSEVVRQRKNAKLFTCCVEWF